VQVTLDIPDELAAALAFAGQDPPAPPSKPSASKLYRQRRLSAYQLRILLGIPSRWELDAFLKEHQVETYTAGDFEHDLDTLQHVEETRKAERRRA